MSVWLERRVIAFAHQGGSFEGPSSTLVAIERALAAGASAIELDVHATKDRAVVVSHDATVDRTTNHRGAISDLTLSQLRDMDNAYWWIEGETVTPGREPSHYLLRGLAPRDRRYGFATFEEVWRAFPGVLYNLDIKGTSPGVEGYEELLASELRRLGATESVIVASFHDDALARFRVLAPEVATSAGTRECADFFFSLAEKSPRVAPVCAFQVPVSFGGHEVITERFVDVAHRHAVAVHAWTVNDIAEMDRLIDLGVDAVISDRPGVLANLLKRRGLAWGGELI